MIPSAEAARNTDDLRTTAIPGNGAEEGGWRQNDSKSNDDNDTRREFIPAKMSSNASLSTEPLFCLEFDKIATLAKYQRGAWGTRPKTQGG